jgi:transmembrane sensor
MNKNYERFTYLLQLYTSGKISANEHDELFELIATHNYDSLLSQAIQKDLAQDQFDKAADLPPHIAEEIVRNIFRAERNTFNILPLKKTTRYIGRWAVAASVIIAITFTGYFLFSVDKTKNNKESFARLIPDNTITKINNTNKQEVITLPDSSHVTLQPYSTLHYAHHFIENKREVFLEGEAFFSVTKDTTRPFLVYYNNIVTKVLGTSFTINTNAKTGNIEVSVKTGKVQVYENDKLVLAKDQVNKAVILTPNQRAVYKPQVGVFETLLVEKPQPIIDENGREDVFIPFVYEQEKLLNVFKHIETSYGIEIILENPGLNNCVFTGDVSSQDLDTKLKIICLTTNSSYEINGTKILIKGNGCK